LWHAVSPLQVDWSLDPWHVMHTGYTEEAGGELLTLKMRKLWVQGSTITSLLQLWAWWLWAWSLLSREEGTPTGWTIPSAKGTPYTHDIWNEAGNQSLRVLWEQKRKNYILLWMFSGYITFTFQSTYLTFKFGFTTASLPNHLMKRLWLTSRRTSSTEPFY